MSDQYNILSNEDCREIEVWASRAFAEMVPNQERGAATFYRLELPSGKVCHVKLFKHKDLFAVESAAFQGLENCDRVCRILFSSRRIARQKPDYSGPYFLVKPNFTKKLDVQSTPLKLLDDAAQLTDMAIKLWEEGWYDFDEHWENEGFDEEGHLIRFDLDAAFCFKKPLPKFNAVFHMPLAADYYHKLNMAYEGLSKESFIISSVAVKLCRYLLDRRGNFEQLNALLSSAPSQAAITDGGAADQAARGERSSLNKIRTTLGGSLRKVSGAVPRTAPATVSPKQNGSKKSGADEEWLTFWKNRLIKKDAGGASLIEAETVFLGLLFQHIFQGQAPDWKLRDLYYSLLLLLGGSLQKIAQANPGESAQQPFNNLIEKLHEFKHLAKAVVKEEPAQAKQASVPSERIVHRIPTDKIGYAGDYWGATKKQGWECQDITLASENPHFPIFVLADGVSGANGGEAVKIVESVCQHLFKKIELRRDAQKPVEWVTELVKRTNEELIEHYKQTKLPYQTTMVVAMLSPKLDDRPSVTLAQFGNSPWLLIKKDKEDETPSVHENTRNCEDKMLGKSRIKDIKWITDEITEIPLGTGSYSVRACSDGIPPKLRDGLKSLTPIKELVPDVAQWASKYPSDVGHDDWSVAGFDFEVIEETISPSRDKEPKGAATKGGTDWRQVCYNIRPAQFPLSQPALEFWQQTLEDPRCQQISNADIVNQIVGSVERVEPKQQGQSAPSPTPQPSRKPAWLDDPYTWRILNRISVVVVIVLVVGALGYFFLWPSSSTNNSNANRTTASASPTPSITSGRTYDNPEQNELFNKLNKGERVTYDSLPSGDGVDGEPFQKLIPNLAEVLRTNPSWKVLVEVHTDLSGTQAQNYSASRNRGDKLINRLVEKGVRKDLLKLEYKGADVPAIPHPKDTAEANKNRRIVIARL